MKNKWFLVVMVLAVLISTAVMIPQAKAGNVNLEEICTSQGMALVLDENNAYGWKCEDLNGGLNGMNLNSYCVEIYGEDFGARYHDFDRPASWNCAPETANFKQK